MNNEEKILSILEAMQSDIAMIKNNLDKNKSDDINVIGKNVLELASDYKVLKSIYKDIYYEVQSLKANK